jgi:demethylmacrocin O-methyltransferase
MKLTDLEKKYPTKGKTHFLKIYENYFSSLKNKKINILEIGVYEGKSLMIWKSYFPNANIVGIDIQSYNFQIERITTFVGDQADLKFLSSLLKKYRNFDVIIDDGSHISKDIIKSFTFLFDFLVDGGIYIVEDLQTSYFPRYGGSRINLKKNNTSINFFKSLIDSGNYEKNDRPFYKKNKFDGNIKFVHFYQNLMILKKGKTLLLQYKNSKNRGFINCIKKYFSQIFFK